MVKSSTINSFAFNAHIKGREKAKVNSSANVHINIQETRNYLDKTNGFFSKILIKL